MPERVDGSLSVETPESVAFSYELAGLGSRGVAFALDMLVLAALILAEAVAVAAVTILVSYLVNRNLLALAGIWALAGLLVLIFVTYWGYFVFGEVARGGRTVGKKALKIRVMRDDGSRVGLVDSLIRNFLRLVDALPGSYAVGIASILLSKKQKRVGDIVAGTVVVRDAGRPTLLTDGGGSAQRDVLAAEFLARRADMTPEARHQVATAVLAAFGEEAGTRDEHALCARVAELVEAARREPLT